MVVVADDGRHQRIRQILLVRNFHLAAPIALRLVVPDGSPIRDYVNVVDLADAHEKAIRWLLDHETGSEIINIGTGTGNSVHEIINTVKQLTGKDFPVGTASDRRQNEADKMIASNEKAKKVLGWTPTHTLASSVQSLITWYTKHPKGWKS
jgi:UDP-glucose 4-epimerase